jgi:hydroxymethylpyrimidine/phosphomethylpyrimidine kinase
LILEDMDIAACKIGMIGSVALIDIIHSELTKIQVPIVLDPVISSTTGQAFADEAICKNMLKSLLPLTTIITPNSIEAKTLTQSSDLTTAADSLLDYGTDSVLITGTHEETDNVINTFYTKPGSPTEYHWERLPDTFHGSGCTLSSRIAALLALGNDLQSAVENAQAYTWNTLKHGLKLGCGQAQPDRFFK